MANDVAIIDGPEDHPEPEDWAITRDEAGLCAAAGNIGMIVGPNGSIVKRNGLKFPSGRKTRWLRGELNGVKVFFDGKSILITTEEVWP